MSEINIGDIVARKSYGEDIFFKVQEIKKENKEPIALLKGLEMRLLADAPLHDLTKKRAEEIFYYRHRNIEKCKVCLKRILKDRSLPKQESDLIPEEDGEKPGHYFPVPGRVLHLDGDEEYLEKCLRSYAKLEIEVLGFHVSEKNQPRVVKDYLKHYSPDILILTGHDGLIKGKRNFRDLDNYRTSKYFVEAVKKAREVEPNRDELVIFAGACQSHYEAILKTGANFASSPQRVLIHTYDPVFIAEKIAYTPTDKLLSLKDVIAYTVTGSDGIGGIQTRGCFRLGYPKSPY